MYTPDHPPHPDAAAQTPLGERLSRRATEPLGLIDTLHSRRKHAEAAQWVARHFPLLADLLARHGDTGTGDATDPADLDYPRPPGHAPLVAGSSVVGVTQPPHRGTAATPSPPAETFRLRRSPPPPLAETSHAPQTLPEMRASQTAPGSAAIGKPPALPAEPGRAAAGHPVSAPVRDSATRTPASSDAAPTAQTLPSISGASLSESGSAALPLAQHDSATPTTQALPSASGASPGESGGAALPLAQHDSAASTAQALPAIPAPSASPRELGGAALPLALSHGQRTHADAQTSNPARQQHWPTSRKVLETTASLVWRTETPAGTANAQGRREDVGGIAATRRDAAPQAETIEILGNAQHAPQADIDIRQIAEQVERILGRKLIAARERRGGRKC